ncbi:hypothetical protein M011DRAFT_494763 [Sporormia fimetaria CBS 119925]|uniref:C3H1-type domain-containing protein n=1 Tax=Sporormia fimetaria CBS 119925 TaxID=1340428 RepID=A0A6A6V8J0_9PLEO|nr:hypothetical protein M011DRAFT_494763 [Sporormia fimetaria CBS 119925]
MSNQPGPEVVTDEPRLDAPPPSHAPPQSLAFSHQVPPVPHTQSAAARSQNSRLNHRPSGDFRHPPGHPNMPGGNGNGPMPVPGGPHGRNGHPHAAHMRDMGFAGPRSPPNNKSKRRLRGNTTVSLTSDPGTAHVPCKFYRQGACQAGKACPFLHSDEPITERAPCKYFAKGNCKFGHKCALAHILPNGHVINHNMGGRGGGPFGRMNIPHHPEPAPNSSLLSMQAHMAPVFPPPPPPPGHDDFPNPPFETIPTIDTTWTSHTASNYGSPPNESGRLPISPVQKGLSVMDVPLPASFDSQGISHVARYGPIAASVPSAFFGTSPPASFQGEGHALRNLHSTAFGDGARARPNALGSSPPDAHEPPIGRRIMHSDMGAHRRGMLSASVGAPIHPDEDWDAEYEDLIPGSLGDLLTPQEKQRRFSRDRGNEGIPLSHRGSFSRLGASPTMSDLKPSSPSRFQSLWGKTSHGLDSGSVPGPSSLGHVGSPLRNSSLHPGASPSLRPMGRPLGDASGLSSLSSPPRQPSMGMLTQQLSRTRLTSRPSDEVVSGLGANPKHPGISRVASGSSVGSGGRLGIDRAVSSSSISRSERIDEEQGLFSMEEEELDNDKAKDNASTASTTSNKRLSGLSWGSGGKASPSLAPIGGHRGLNNGPGRDSIW